MGFENNNVSFMIFSDDVSELSSNGRSNMIIFNPILTKVAKLPTQFAFSLSVGMTIDPTDPEKIVIVALDPSGEIISEIPIGQIVDNELANLGFQEIAKGKKTSVGITTVTARQPGLEIEKEGIYTFEARYKDKILNKTYIIFHDKSGDES